MKLEYIDWSVIRGALIGLVTSLILGALLIGGSVYFRENMKKEFTRNNSQFQNISRRYLAVDEEEKLIQEYYPEFIALFDKGIIGNERRLDWIEVLRKYGREIKLPSLSYTIESQKEYTPTFPVNLRNYQLYRSTMRLNMQLLHEGDLFSLLEALDKYARGNYSVSECELRNSTRARLNEDPKATNVNVECQLEWFTIKLANGREIKV